MSDSNYIKIFTGSLINVQRIISDLEKIDISPVIKDQNESGLDPKIYGGHLLKEIYVHKDELEKAHAIIKNIN
ncbi:putative signal transducing protein [Gelatiniphilus marinus]|uniref:Signal transducing protein n=1 Tax=Gelatiniphilus marinus TaxID=1759464 RepID=A0ABW5JNR8_9FLAO